MIFTYPSSLWFIDFAKSTFQILWEMEISLANGAATMGIMKENAKVRNKEEGSLNSDLIINKSQSIIVHIFKCKL